MSIRSRYIADRILLILLYRPGEEEIGLTRLEDGSILVRTGAMARSLKMNSSKLYDQFLYLQHAGYVDLLDLKYKFGQIRIRPTRPAVKWPSAPLESVS